MTSMSSQSEHAPPAIVNTSTVFDTVESVITGRRTSMHVDPEREVPTELIERLCELAAWAPCHKRTWPWRFALVTGAGRARLGEVASDAMMASGEAEPKVAKTRTKYLRTPATLVVGSCEGDSPTRTVENRDATAAAIQNLLLAATGAGLASFWSSCPKGAHDAVAQWCDFPTGTTVVAMIYLGWSNGTASPVPQRPPVALTLKP